MLRVSKSNIFDFLKFIVTVALIVVPVRLFVAQPFIVQGASMDPTFRNADYLIVDEISFKFREPRRGEVVIFRYPRDPSKFYIKRIIGLPGEMVEIQNGKIFVKTKDGSVLHKLNEAYFDSGGISDGTDMNIFLKEAEYFVMGDNRSKSSDSRHWGALPKKLIVGRALLRLWPVDKVSYLPGNHGFSF
jgi:signal peptidase I